MADVDLQTQCNAIRTDLKIWEKNFAAEHEGRKASREDIKADAAISQKYKDYNKLREELSGGATPQTPSRRATKRMPHAQATRTEQAVEASMSTPLKRKRDDSGVHVQIAVSPEQQRSPQGPSFIGPTPQRDGKVLGLFDVLSAETPSKARKVLAEVMPNLPCTPSKAISDKKVGSQTSLEPRARGDKTPQSSGKRFLLEQFVTPKRRRLDGPKTPLSALKGLMTPAFLRRDKFLPDIDEGAEGTSPRPAPWKRRSLGRSLSSMIQDLQKQEEHRFDEEEAIMREMEMEAEGGAMPQNSKNKEVLVPDSQVAMPLGPDRGYVSEYEESEEGEQLGADGKPRKVWKKKGLKRQTRRVIMRPNFTKPKPQQEAMHPGIDEEDADPATASLARKRGPHGEGQSNDESDADYASDGSHSSKKRKREHKRPPGTVQHADKAEGNDGPVKSAARKIKATAHANYRRLKIKSKGSNGGKGRFGRRR